MLKRKAALWLCASTLLYHITVNSGFVFKDFKGLLLNSISYGPFIFALLKSNFWKYNLCLWNFPQIAEDSQDLNWKGWFYYL